MTKSLQLMLNREKGARKQSLNEKEKEREREREKERKLIKYTKIEFRNMWDVRDCVRDKSYLIDDLNTIAIVQNMTRRVCAFIIFFKAKVAAL